MPPSTLTSDTKKRPSAYDIILSTDLIQPREFSQLIGNFEKSLLQFYQYDERISKHRKPTMVKQEVYQVLCKLAVEIQNRPEMIDVDPITRNSGIR